MAVLAERIQVRPERVQITADGSIFSYVDKYAPFSPAEHEGSLANPAARARALDLMEQGIPIVFQMGEVVGMMVDSTNWEAIERTLKVKKDSDLNRKWSTFMPAREALKFADREKVHPDLHWLLDNPDQADMNIGFIFHLLIPVRKDKINELPELILSTNQDGDTHYLQFFSTFGHPYISDLVREAGKRFPGRPVAVTTFNRHSLKPGQSPEITSLKDAREFFVELGGKVQMLLVDPTCALNNAEDPQESDYKARGSFLIINAENLTAVRDGVVPVGIAEDILGIAINKVGMKPSNFPPPEYSVDIANLKSRVAKRAAVRLSMNGKFNGEIYENLKKLDEKR